MSWFIVSRKIQDGENQYYGHCSISADNWDQAHKKAEEHIKLDNDSDFIRETSLLGVTEITDKEKDTLEKFGVI